MRPVGTFWRYSRARRRPTRSLSPIGLGHLLHGRPQAALNQRNNADDVRPAELIGPYLKHGYLVRPCEVSGLGSRHRIHAHVLGSAQDGLNAHIFIKTAYQKAGRPCELVDKPEALNSRYRPEVVVQLQGKIYSIAVIQGVAEGDASSQGALMAVGVTVGPIMD